MKKDKKNTKNSSEQVTKNKLESTFTKKSVSKNEGTIPPVTHKSFNFVEK
ncbi:hypothetical protein [Spiroplasma endosymbiont of Amphimallon solstitiale]